MLLDGQGRFLDVDLLDHPRLTPQCGFQIMAALRARADAMIEEPGIDGFGRERISFVLGMSGLATDLALSLTIGGSRFGRLDDVRRRGLGRRRGILPRRRELLLELRDRGLKRSETRLLRIQLRLQSPTIRTGLPCLGFHGSLC